VKLLPVTVTFAKHPARVEVTVTFLLREPHSAEELFTDALMQATLLGHLPTKCHSTPMAEKLKMAE
jgi:hypothetical protein